MVVSKPGRDSRCTIRIPPKLLTKLEAEVEERGMEWENRTEIVISALSEYYINRDPEKRKAEIIRAFRENPDALRDLVQQIIYELVGKKPSF